MPAENVVERIHHAGPLQRPQVADLLHHHDQRRVAPRVLADGARGDGVDIAAVGAFDDLGRRLVERCSQRLQEIHAPLEQRQRRLARRAVP